MLLLLIPYLTFFFLEKTIRDFRIIRSSVYDNSECGPLTTFSNSFVLRKILDSLCLQISSIPSILSILSNFVRLIQCIALVIFFVFKEAYSDLSIKGLASLTACNVLM